MKYALSIIGLVCLVAAVGCNNQTPASVSSGVVAVAQNERYRFNAEIASLNKALNEFREYREYLENDPRFLFYLMDRDLDAVEQGREARGSFSDYFVPNAAKALKAGAARKDIATRIDRVIALAEKEIYLSSLVAQLMKEGGSAAVRSYADEWIRGSQK